MIDNEDQVMQYLLYETDILTNQHSGFILNASNKDEVIQNLEGESFLLKYYVISGPNGSGDIRSKQALKDWYKQAQF